MTNDRNCLLEKALSCLHISFFAHQRINQIAIMIDSPIQVTPVPMHFDVRLIDVPRSSCLPTSFYP
jgi:hypothetical protein